MAAAAIFTIEKSPFTATTTDPDESLNLNDVMDERNHEELFLWFLLLLVPAPRVDEQVEHRVRQDLHSTHTPHLSQACSVLTTAIIIIMQYITLHTQFCPLVSHFEYMLQRVGQDLHSTYTPSLTGLLSAHHHHHNNAIHHTSHLVLHPGESL